MSASPSYGQQFCPVAQAAEIVTRRWMPLIVRELLCGSTRFNDLHRGVPRMSRTLLARRLGELETAGVVSREIDADGHPSYRLTEAGEDLRPIIIQLGVWGKRWVQHRVTRDGLDAGLMMWDIHRRIVREALPAKRTIVHFHFTDAPAHQRDFWLVLDQGDVDLCLRDPGGEPDLRLLCDMRTLTDVWLGDLTFGQALARRMLSLTGRSDLRRAVPTWLRVSMFASERRRTAPASRGRAVRA